MNKTKLIVDQINDHILKDRVPQPGPYRLYAVDHITCESGLQISVQGSGAHYCSPKNDVGPYTAVEVLVCNLPDRGRKVMEQFFEKQSNDGDTYNMGWVPIEDVANLIIANGGIKRAEGIPKVGDTFDDAIRELLHVKEVLGI